MNNVLELRDLSDKLERGYIIKFFVGKKAYVITAVRLTERGTLMGLCNDKRWRRLHDYDVIRPDYISPAGRRPSDWGYRDEDSLMAILLMD